MAKTLVMPAHKLGPHTNGFDDCYARLNDGLCPGGRTADWLNGLGDDDEPYTPLKDANGQMITCGRVRDNWLTEGQHIVAKEPKLAELAARKRALSAQLRIVEKAMKQAGKFV